MWPAITKIVAPTANQMVLSCVLSILALTLIFQSHLIVLITGASGITPSELHSSYYRALTTINNVGFVPKLTIGLFWACVGMVAYFLALTAFNFVIALRNEVVVDTTFTNMGAVGLRFRLPILRLALTAVLGAYLALAVVVLLPLWIQLTGHLLLVGFSITNLLLTLVAIIGLATTIYVGWMLALAIKDLDDLL